MKDAFFPQINLDETLISPSEETMGEILTEAEYHDLYTLARDEGLPYFARINAQGDVEFYLIYDQIQAFHESTRDVSSIEFKTYRDTLLAIIWTITEPIHPLGFPLSFHCKESRDRYMALQLSKQSETHIHHLLYSDQHLIHIYTETNVFSSNERQRIEELVHFLYEEDKLEDENPITEEVKEEPIQTIAAASLPIQLLRDRGTAYEFDFARMLQTYGEEEASTLLMDTLHQALLVMRRHARSDVRESSCTIWVAEKQKVVRVYITPNLEELFTANQFARADENPFQRFLHAIPEFIKSEEVTPLHEGAYPIFRFDHAKLYHLELDESFQHKLARLYAEIVEKKSNDNPYLPKI